MNKSKLAKILDIISFLLLFFIIQYWLLNKTSLNQEIKLVLALFMSILITTTIIKITDKKNNISITNSLEKEKLDNIRFSLKFGNPLKIKEFWIKLFSKKYNVFDSNSHLKLSSNNTKINFYYDFNSLEVPLTKLTEIASKHSNEIIYFCGNKFSDDALIFEKQNNFIHLLDFDATIIVFKKYSIYPTIKHKKITKTSLLKKFLNSVSKQKTLSFVKYGTLLIVIGFLFKRTKFYIFFALILFLLAFISFKNKKVSQSSSITEI